MGIGRFYDCMLPYAGAPLVGRSGMCHGTLAIALKLRLSVHLIYKIDHQNWMLVGLSSPSER